MNMDDEELTAEQLASIAAESEGDDSDGDDDVGTGEDQVDGADKGTGSDGAGQPTEVEELAAESGWSPKDKWRGNADDWVDARTFIRQGTTILRSTLKRQDGELGEMRTTMGEFRDHYRNVEQRAHDRAVAEHKAEQRAAVEEGDTAAYDAAGEKIDELDKEAPAKATKAAERTQDEDPNFKAFSADNPWYGNDIKMTAYAESISAVVGRKHAGQAFYDKIAEEVRAEFPDKFRNAARRKPSRVEGSGAGTMRRGNGNGKTYADLPAADKAVCDRLVKQMVKNNETGKMESLLTREQYVSDYEWE